MTIAEDAWPVRRHHDLAAIVAAMPKQLSETRIAPTEADWQQHRVSQRIPVMSVEAVLPCGQGIMRSLVRLDSRGNPIWPDQFPDLQFLSFRPGTEPPEELAGDGSFDMLRYIFSGDHFSVLLPEGKPRGLLFHFTSLTGDAYSKELVCELGERGWVVVTADHPLISSGLTITVDEPDAVGKAAIALAKQVDEQLAEQAYSVEAALEFLARQHPEVPQRPLVLMGFSAGSLAVPTVSARLGDRVDAAVLVAGGANLYELTRDSSVSDGGLRVDWGQGVETDELRRELSERYLEASELDPHHTSLAMHGTPTLVLLGRFDRIAPIRNGQQLWERLGRPERLSFFGGHSILFWRLPAWKEWIADWVERESTSSTGAL